MRLEITRKADLATRALLVLAAEDRRLKASELAARLGTTAGFLPQVLGPLVERGWVGSEPGPTGGYRLEADPRQLSVLEVVEAVDGPTETGRCVLEHQRSCGTDGACALHAAWARARTGLVEELQATRLADLAGLAAPATGRRA